MTQHWTRAMIVPLVLVFVACDDGPNEPRVLYATCDAAPGTAHVGSADGELWKAADGPHHVAGVVTGDSLAIEAGALVCAADGAAIHVTTLTAIGTVEAPILFTAEDPARPWEGLRLWGTEDLGESRLEHVVVRNTADHGVHARSLELVSSRVVNTCLRERVCAGVTGVGYGGIDLQDVVIDSSGSHGVASSRRAGVSLHDVRILNSAGVGLNVSPEPGSVRLEAENVRITGGGSYPAVVDAVQALEIAGSQAQVDSLLGNARDSLIVETGAPVDSARVYAALPWIVREGIFSGADLMTTRAVLEPGASVTFEAPWIVWAAHAVEALGTATAPIRISDTTLDWSRADSTSAPDTVRLSYAILDDVYVSPRNDGGAVVHVEMDNVSARRSSVRLGSGTLATIRHAEFDSASITIEGADVVLDDVDFRNATDSIFPWDWPGARPPHAIAVDSGTVTLTNCSITGSEGDGLRFAAGAGAGSTIAGCNLVDNGGFGVNNLSTFTVDATDNWWGDPAGPNGPAGDGVSGDVAVDPVRTSPVQR